MFELCESAFTDLLYIQEVLSRSLFALLSEQSKELTEKNKLFNKWRLEFEFMSHKDTNPSTECKLGPESQKCITNLSKHLQKHGDRIMCFLVTDEYKMHQRHTLRLVVEQLYC